MKDYYYSIASGSKGNCSLVCCGGSRFLIDLGVSVRNLKKTLAGLDLEIEDLTGILLTHAHSDHIKGLETLVKKYDVPLYASVGTAWEICEKVPTAKGKISEFLAGSRFGLEQTEIQSVRTPHDSSESVGYVFAWRGGRLGFATDLGFMPSGVEEELLGCDTVVLESNHDLEMLAWGPYPEHLKARIRGNRGHLSNEDCAACACDLVRSGTQRLILAHLSETNNRPELALATTQKRLAAEHLDCQVLVAPVKKMEQPLLLKGDAPCWAFD